MSKLQELVNKLVGIVVSYRQTQKPNLAEADIKNISTMALDDLIATLHRLTEAMTYPDRKPLMRFFISAIEQVKPIVDQSEPLSKKDKHTIHAVLVHLLAINATLLQRTQSPPHLLITYGDTTEEMPGFVRGVLKSYTYCNSGQIIKNALFKSQDIAELTENCNFQDIIRQLIRDHQKPLLKNFYMEQEINSLKEKLAAINSICDKTRVNMEQLSIDHHSALSALEAEKNKSQLAEEENRMLKARLLANEKIITQLRQCNHDLNQQVATLTKTKSDAVPLSASLVEGKASDLIEDTFIKSPRGSRPSYLGFNFLASSLLFNPIRPAEPNEDDAPKKSF